jgi:prepilin-type N-terminal cleavage/methylation domain-containing protein
MKRRDVRGFTLVELIIVIIILGILAALAIPQFISSTGDSTAAVRDANLQAMNSSLTLYYHQHDEHYPGAVLTGADDGGDAADDDTAFLNQMTGYTNKAGEHSLELDREDYPFGPYFKDGIPENPSAATAPTLVTVESAGTTLTTDGDTGWLFDTLSGQLMANHAAAE